MQIHVAGYEFIEDRAEFVKGGDVDGDVIVAAAQVLHERMASGQDRSVLNDRVSGRASAGAGLSAARDLVCAENGVASCGLGVFVDQTAEPVPAQDAHAGHFR